jgi:uncharacterized BrkB/YihY/UPF0761 family membrane protein
MMKCVAIHHGSLCIEATDSVRDTLNSCKGYGLEKLLYLERGRLRATTPIVAQPREIVGEEGALAVESILNGAREPAKGAVATIAGFAILLLGATAVFAMLQSALDRIWRVPAQQMESVVWNLLRTRLMLFGFELGLGSMLTVSLVVSAALAALGKWWGA